MTMNERLKRIRANYRRLLHLLTVDDRNRLICAEIAHEAAHMAEHVAALDTALMLGEPLPLAWTPPVVHCSRAEETSPTA